MQCPTCNFENPAGINFCGGCGAPFEKTCQKCGVENPTAFKFCGACGTSLAAPSQPGSSKQITQTTLEPKKQRSTEAERRREIHFPRQTIPQGSEDRVKGRGTRPLPKNSTAERRKDRGSWGTGFLRGTLSRMIHAGVRCVEQAVCWRVGGLASWRVGELAGWRVGELAS